MRSGLELHDSRISGCEFRDGGAYIYFSHAYIHKSSGSPGKGPGTGWSQEAVLGFPEVGVISLIPKFPGTILHGSLMVGGIRHEILPLPFRRRGAGQLMLEFDNGDRLEIDGIGPYVELSGTPHYLEEFP